MGLRHMGKMRMPPQGSTPIRQKKRQSQAELILPLLFRRRLFFLSMAPAALSQVVTRNAEGICQERFGKH